MKYDTSAFVIVKILITNSIKYFTDTRDIIKNKTRVWIIIFLADSIRSHSAICHCHSFFTVITIEIVFILAAMAFLITFPEIFFEDVWIMYR